MNYPSILVHVDASSRTAERVRIAAEMALRDDAHLIGTATTGVSGLFYLPGAIGEGNLQLGAMLDMLKQRGNFALEGFTAIVDKMGVRSFETRLADEEAGPGISLQARYCDLVIIGQTDPGESSPSVTDQFPEYVVMHSARPVLIIPYAGHFEHIGRRVLIGWDGSMQATRAVTASIALLRQAGSVQLVVFNPTAKAGVHGDQPGADIALYLARHGIKVEVSVQTTYDSNSSIGRTTDLDIGNALLSHAADIGADLIVMGGYAHSRFRQVLLGGVTNTILSSMTVPVLMAH
ncbi:universal stress protein [Actimicrobium antarcticum]|uniref:Universal stress protein n=1 Tax=Actimicrobium antarcticum TaxID=1051899 RepID=A0ABP7TLM5_9BURK